MSQNKALLTILFKVDELESVSDVGSREASGELLREPVDIGEGDVAGWLGGMVGATGASRRSRNGFLLLLGDVNGLDLPMVANFCVWFSVSDCDCVVEVIGAVGMEGIDGMVGMVGMVGGGTKFPTNGLVLLVPLLAVSVVAVVVGEVETPELRKLSEKRVSLCSPAIPFSEK